MGASLWSWEAKRGKQGKRKRQRASEPTEACMRRGNIDVAREARAGSW